MNLTQTRWFRIGGLALALLAVFFLGRSFQNAPREVDHAAPQNEAVASVWTCSMHPQIQMPEPGQCPICGMDLIPVTRDTGTDDGPRSLTLSAHAQALAKVETTPVSRRSVETTLRMVGKLSADETRVREIAAWVPGRIDRLHVDYTGVAVRTGQELFDLYSPDLYSAQQELIQAIRASAQLTNSGMESTRLSATRTINAARQRLRLWGLTETQVAEIENRGEPSDHVTIVAPMSGVVLHKNAVEGSYVKMGTHVYTIADLSLLWLKLDVYESDISWIEVGQVVEFETDVHPGRSFEGTVTFIDPVLDERTRSVKVRVDVPNPDGQLKPGMFARAVLRAAVGVEAGRLPLVIPASAPLITGTRAVVYVADPERPGTYHGREIVLGPRAGDHFVVLSGLEDGELVVSNGSFKIDSALQIRAKKSMMSPEGGVPAPGHDHGDHPEPAPMAHDTAETIPDIPEDFRRQLDDVVSDYVALSTALSHDDFDAARAAAAALPGALRAIDHDLLPSAAHTRWADSANELSRASTLIAATSDIGGARDAFYDLSEQMIETVRLFGASGETPVFVYHCPMAKRGAGADWIQTTVGTENPYYGSKMFTCGSQTETLVAGPGAGADPAPGNN